jgi:hypothetical protein
MAKKKKEKKAKPARVEHTVYGYTFGMLETLTPTLGPVSLSYTMIPRGYPTGSYLEY